MVLRGRLGDQPYSNGSRTLTELFICTILPYNDFYWKGLPSRPVLTVHMGFRIFPSAVESTQQEDDIYMTVHASVLNRSRSGYQGI